jgi:carbonic anhydrase/acetyltransferase-like protein (isoleucine patch superfamily)
MVRPVQGKSPRIHETAFVAETADVIGDVEVGEHSSIWFHSGPLHGGAVAGEDW